jgi:hypothetical protein
MNILRKGLLKRELGRLDVKCKINSRRGYNTFSFCIGAKFGLPF